MMERLIFFLWREAADVAGMKEGRDGWREEGCEMEGWWRDSAGLRVSSQWDH